MVDSDLSYNNISKQIDEGIREVFAEAEVVRGVLRTIKPGAFRDMLVMMVPPYPYLPAMNPIY